MITEGTQQVLTVLYPLYKEEVYRRREQMMRLTAFGSLGLIAMLFALLLSPQKNRLGSFDTLIIGVASLIWGGLFCALILQQQYRHRLAKQVLVQLEQALGFYEEGLVVEHQALYPESWKTAWLGDRTGILYFTTIGSLTALLLLALIFS
jgi:membrane associated rhomboid family serine protease